MLSNEVAVRTAWSQEAFMRGGQQLPQLDDAEDVRAQLLRDICNVSAAVAAAEFWSSLKLMQALQGTPPSIEGWAGGCPCHGDAVFLAGPSRFKLSQVYKSLSGAPGEAPFCPFAGHGA